MDASSATRSAAIAYAKAGLAVIPLHHVGDDGGCSCRAWTEHRDPDHGPGGKATGKHPVQRRWAAGPALSGADVWEVWEREPRANVGLRTGPISGFWVLDVDPLSGGEASLRRLMDEVGPLTTLTVRTGSGGWHLYFTLPSFPVRNSGNRELLRRFGPGLDVRGDGGQVVAPPSVSGRGSYAVLPGLPTSPCGAPVALLELMQAGGQTSTGAAPDLVVVEELPVAADLDPATAHRVQRYAEQVLRLEAAAYADAPPGSGNEQLFRSACSVLEIAQAPWNTISSATAYETMDAARARRSALHPYGGGQSTTEFATTWASAVARVVGQARALPPAPDEGVDFTDPFGDGPAGRAGGAAEIPTVVPTASTEVAVADPFSQPGEDGPATGPAVPAPPTRIPAAPVESGDPVLDRLLRNAVDCVDLGSIPPPEPLIEGVLDVGSMAVLSGKFGTFKTFLALDWVCSLATGTPWMGRAVPRAVPVVYIAAEGASGLDRRIGAWKKARGVSVPRGALTVLRAAVQLGQPAQIAALCRLVRALGAGLVVFDTLHRCAAGLDEKDSKDMGQVTAAVDAIREHTGAATLLMHHTGHGGERARGSSAIEDDADVSWLVSLTGDGEDRSASKPRLVEQRKRKDGDLARPFHVRFQREEGFAEGDPRASGHLTLSDRHGLEIAPGPDPFHSPGPQLGVARLVDPAALTGPRAKLIQVYLDYFSGANGGTQAAVKRAAKEHYGVVHSSFHWAWNDLVERGAIARVAGTQSWRYIPPEHRGGGSDL